MSREPILERLSAICAAVGFDLDSATPSLVGRLKLLAERSQTVADCERMAAMAQALFAYRDFSETEQRIVVLGCVLSDIGKTGPINADGDAQRLIVEMFAVEGVRDDTQSVARFFATYFAADAEARRQRFAALGLDPSMSMRAFWNLHSGWTLEVLEQSSVPREAIAAAATHHLLDDVNPGAIVADSGGFTRTFGENTSFDRAEKLIILLDKYDALRRRGKRSHEQAIAWLEDRLRGSRRFHDDPEFLSLLDDMKAVLGAA